MPEASEDRILYMLKSRGDQTAMAIAAKLGMTSVGARKHLANLHDSELVDYADRREDVGRPKRYWRLSQKGHARFPDAHSDLTLELLTSVRRVFGEAGLEKLIDDREAEAEAGYKRAMAGCDDLEARVERLAEIRDREGYMAEWTKEPDGTFLLMENHCPICAAATQCQGLCRSELVLFRAVLGRGVMVERIEHILTGARRCSYRISQKTRNAGKDRPC
ncbi:MAG: metalloregulator ArsR/SmtB family transcription factor [Pseudomonadota bacterium]